MRTTTSPTNNFSLLATALAGFRHFCVPEYVLGSLSLLSDAGQRRNLDSWLGGNGLVGEWGLFVGAYNATHQHLLVKPCASAPKSYSTVIGCVGRGGGVIIVNVSKRVN